MDNDPTPDDVADVLWLGVLEQGTARLPALCDALARAAPAGASTIPEDHVRAQSIAAGLAVVLLHLDKRLSPEDRYALHLAIESRAGRMHPELAFHVWLYHEIVGREDGEAMLRTLGREFRARCHQRHPSTLPDDPSDDLSVAELLIPHGTSGMAIDIGRLLRRVGLNRQGQG